jgi:hypothetical protein
MPNIFLKNLEGGLIRVDSAFNIDELILYISEYLKLSPEKLIIFKDDKEISILEEGEIYNFLVRDKDFNLTLLFDTQSTDVDDNKIYNKYILKVDDELFPFYNYDDKFYNYKNVDVLDRFSTFENIRMRDPSVQGIYIKGIVELYFKELPFYDRKYIEKKLLKQWEEINDYEAYEAYEAYEEYEEYEEEYPNYEFSRSYDSLEEL